jgi:hypothetical protein
MARDIASENDCPSTSARCTSRWTAITDAVGAVLPDTNETVHWGLKFFADSPNGCDVSPGVDVVPGPSNASAISAQIAATTPNTGTPTTEIIKATSAYLQSLPTPNPKYILLATDGQPYCGGPKKDQPDDAAAIEAIKNSAFAKGIKVFVVGLAISDANTATLNRMAEAGGTTSFYRADSPDALKAALADISVIVASCSVSLSTTPPDPNNIAVFLDGERLTAEAEDGFILTDNNSKVEVTGRACEALKSGKGKNIQVLMGCAPIPINVIP